MGVFVAESAADTAPQLPAAATALSALDLAVPLLLLLLAIQYGTLAGKSCDVDIVWVAAAMDSVPADYALDVEWHTEAEADADGAPDPIIATSR